MAKDIKKLLIQVEQLYEHDKEFKKAFDIDKEKALSNVLGNDYVAVMGLLIDLFGKNAMKNKSFEEFRKEISEKLFLTKRSSELTLGELDNIAGGVTKNKKETVIEKEKIVTKDVPVTVGVKFGNIKADGNITIGDYTKG